MAATADWNSGVPVGDAEGSVIVLSGMGAAGLQTVSGMVRLILFRAVISQSTVSKLREVIAVFPF